MNQLLIEFEKRIENEAKHGHKRDVERIKYVIGKMDDEFGSFLAENDLEGRFESFPDLIGVKVVFVSDKTTRVFVGSVISIDLEKHNWYGSKHERKIAKREGNPNFSYYLTNIITSFGKLTFHGGGEWTCYREDNSMEGVAFFC